METIKKREQMHNIAIAILLLMVFGGLFLMGDYGIAGDSKSYMTMGITREPLYPLLLWGMRKIFGEENFFVPLAFLQNLLAYVSVLFVASYFGKKVFRSYWGHWISALILMMPYLMTPIFSRSHLVMTNKIMAEGITLPGYYFFVLFLLKLIYEEEYFLKNTLVAAGISMLLILARGQLLLTAIVFMIVSGIRLIVRKEYKKLYIPVVIMLILFMGNSLFTGIYHYSNSGVFTATASSKPMILANALYVSEREDGENIEDSQLKQLFIRTYEALEQEKMLYLYAQGTVIDKALHHEECHDTISFDYFEPIKNEIYYPGGESDPRNVGEDLADVGYVHYMLEQDEIAASLTKELITHNWDRYFLNYVNVCMLGFVRSIAIEHPLLNVYALFMYIAGLVLFFYTWKKRGFTKEVFFFGMTCVMIVGFVMATSLFLQCITRYMIYNLPFFYIAGAALLLSLFPTKKKE